MHQHSFKIAASVIIKVVSEMKSELLILLCYVKLDIFLSTICLSAKRKIRPHFTVKYLLLFMQHMELKSVMFASLGAFVQNVSLFLCFPYQGLANFSTAVHHPSGCEYCITTADQEFSTIAGLDKLVLCGVGQMALLFIYSLNCVLKNQCESYY